MFWIYYFLVLIGINILSSIVCIFFYFKSRNTDYKALRYSKIRKNIIGKINKFYRDEENVNKLIKSGSLLYRKAQLSNKLNEKGARKEIYFLIISALLGGVISIFADTDKIKAKLTGIGILFDDEKMLSILLAMFFVILGIKLFNIVYNSMDDVKSESYRYELSIIERILNDSINRTSTKVKVSIMAYTNGKKISVAFN